MLTAGLLGSYVAWAHGPALREFTVALATGSAPAAGITAQARSQRAQAAAGADAREAPTAASAGAATTARDREPTASGGDELEGLRRANEALHVRLARLEAALASRAGGAAPDAASRSPEPGDGG
jgi:hypothetical protein